MSGIKIHDVLQGSNEWHHLRNGILTASQFDRILTPSTLKPANNPKSRSFLWEKLAQRITGHADQGFSNRHTERGHFVEPLARDLYREKYADVSECGFITSDRLGFVLGYSPDGLVGDDGCLEIKAPEPKVQAQTIALDRMPDDHRLQVQGGLLISGRKWCDFISYCGGMPMFVQRVHADLRVQEAIVSAAEKFEAQLKDLLTTYNATVAQNDWPMTERVDFYQNDDLADLGLE